MTDRTDLPDDQAFDLTIYVRYESASQVSITCGGACTDRDSKIKRLRLASILADALRRWQASNSLVGLGVGTRIVDVGGPFMDVQPCPTCDEPMEPGEHHNACVERPA